MQIQRDMYAEAMADDGSPAIVGMPRVTLFRIKPHLDELERAMVRPWRRPMRPHAEDVCHTCGACTFLVCVRGQRAICRQIFSAVPQEGHLSWYEADAYKSRTPSKSKPSSAVGGGFRAAAPSARKHKGKGKKKEIALR